MKSAKPTLLLAAVVAVCILAIPLTAVGPGAVVRTKPQSQGGPAAAPAGTPAPPAEGEGEEESLPASEVGENGVYRGAPETFRILDESSGRVMEVKAREFVRGAVAAEMPALYHSEALKAQAVAAYTYAVRQARRQRQNPEEGLKGADFTADPGNLKVFLTEEQAREFYGEDFELYWKKVCQAADEAGRYLLLYEGEPAATAYHAISAGRTEAAANVWTGEELPYLVPVDSEGDLLASDYETTFTISAAELSAKLAAAYPGIQLPVDQAAWIVPAEWSESGYVTRVELGDTAVTGLELRFLLGLRSSHFQVDYQNGLFTFTVQGYGHGVGLSQNGADFMARQGAGFDEILLHYYPGTALALAAG